ncbi:unnamed protein product [Linum tenue]|uniref:TORTIFOLIA1/SINE1-2 N-terminal domain-containing protein n=1 Tax=Linum tenue TaxID=586396 RepID=A0AAV0HFK8_9ROSI|nr:unnamed protein product [Linum tenue]
MGGRNLSPILKRELANLDKDADSRKSAMKALKSYVKEMDSRAIPLFLAQVSETKETGSLSGEYTISLYEVLARVHGPKIVPLIDTIMTTVINTLSASGVSFPLQQACSKVVPAIARYGIEPGTPEDEKRRIIHSLCKPLVEALLATQECLSSGAALCLKTLVDCDNWRFASDEMVNKVCQNVAVALEEKSIQSNSHMALVMSLSKRNALIVEAYARLLIQSGLRILNIDGSQDCGSNSQKRLSAIQMVNFMMKCLDSRSIVSTLGLIMEEMEKCQFDQMAYVKGAAFEALQTAKKISDEGLKLDKSSGSGSVTGSDSFSRRDQRRMGNFSSTPESQTLASFMDYESMIDSPLSRTPISRAVENDCDGNEFDQKSVTRKLWSHENGGVDVSLKDGLFTELAHGGNTIKNSSFGHARRHSSTENGDHHEGEFSGFMPKTPQNAVARSCTPSPQMSRSHLNVDNINMFTSPRKLIRSLQDVDSESYSRQSRSFKSHCSCQYENRPTSKLNQNGFLRHNGYASAENGESHAGGEGMYQDVVATSKLNQNGFPRHNNGYASDENGESYAGGEEMYQDVDESVSSTEDVPPVDADQVADLVVTEKKTNMESDYFENGYQNKKNSCGWLVAFGFAVFSGLASLAMLFDGSEQGHFLPTT